MRFIQTLNKKKVDRPPLWIMRQAGRYLPEYRELREKTSNFLEFCFTPDLATQVTLQPIQRFNFDAAILFSDILTIPHALGVNVEFTSGHGPILEQVTSEDHIKQLRNHIQNVSETLQPVFETVKRTRQELDPEKALIGFCGGPWTVACYMTNKQPSKDTRNLRKLAYENPQAFEEFLEILVESSVIYLKEQIKAGANAIQIFESWAGAAPDQLFDIAIINPLLEICRRIKEKFPHIPILLFPRAAHPEYLLKLVRKGSDYFEGLGLDYTVNLKWACEHLQDDVCLQGNLDPAILLTNPDLIRLETKDMLKAATKKTGYICNLGHGIVPETPIENVEAFVETVHAWKN